MEEEEEEEEERVSRSHGRSSPGGPTQTSQGSPPSYLRKSKTDLLSLSHKGVFGMFGGSLSPPGFKPSSTGQKRCVVSTEIRRVVVCTVVLTFPAPPCMLSPVRHIAVRTAVCSAACRGTAQRLRIPGPPA